MATCIDPQFVEKIKQLDLPMMNSEQRIKALNEIMGSGGEDINKLYEHSLLLKNQETAFGKFINDITGVSAEKKAQLKARIAQDLANKRGMIYNADGTVNENFKSFDYTEAELVAHAQEVLNKKYNLDIPNETVQKLFNIKKEADALALNAKGTVDDSPEKLAWGQKLVEYDNIIRDLKTGENIDWKQAMKQSFEEAKQRIIEREGAGGKIGQTLAEVTKGIFAIPAKGIKAAWDMSYLFRQGLKVLTADPKIWGKQAKQSTMPWTHVYNKQLMKEVVDAFKADMVSRDLYQDAVKSKLALGVIEDFFPTNIAERVPVVGNLFKASDDSFTMFAQGTRMDLFEKYVNIYKNTHGGAMPDKKFMDSLANYVNGLTGRGGLGKAEASSGWLNQLLFSARYQVANLKTFLDPFTAKDKAVQKIATRNLAVHTGAIISIMAGLAAVTDVGFDPRQTTFGKARIPGTKKWVDVTGGLGSYLSVIFRAADKLDGKLKYGEATALDILIDFAKGKLAPVPGALRDILEQKTYAGKKPTIASTLSSFLVPISADNFIQNLQKKEDLDTAAWAAIFDIIGAGVSQPKSKMEGSYWSPFKQK